MAFYFFNFFYEWRAALQSNCTFSSLTIFFCKFGGLNLSKSELSSEGC